MNRYDEPKICIDPPHCGDCGLVGVETGHEGCDPTTMRTTDARATIIAWTVDGGTRDDLTAMAKRIGGVKRSYKDGVEADAWVFTDGSWIEIAWGSGPIRARDKWSGE